LIGFHNAADLVAIRRIAGFARDMLAAAARAGEFLTRTAANPGAPEKGEARDTEK